MSRTDVFFISLIIAIFTPLIFSPTVASAYSSADIPVYHWSYDAVEKLAIAGLLSLSGTDTRPMTRVQMAYKIKEAMDNIEEEKLPPYLCFDREHIEYLQHILYKLINEFRQELILIGVTAAQLKSEDESRPANEVFNFNAAFPIETEQRFVSIKARKDELLENENGLRIERGYNLRVRANSWANVFGLFTFSARPAVKVTASDKEAFLDEAAAKFSLFNVEIAVAKSAMWWGPGFHGAMLISNNAAPLNLVKIRSINNFRLPWVFQNLGAFGINFFISRLEKSRTIPEPNFMGLRIEYSPLPYLTVSANRVSIMGGKGRPKLNFTDYWKIFVASGTYEFSKGGEIKKTDTDQLASFGAKFVMPFKPEMRIASGMEVYGEWAGEDRFAFWENESPGFLTGLFLTDLFRDKGTDLRIEYAKTKPAWYVHGIYGMGSGITTAYAYKGEIMGHHMGGDADDLFMRISKDMPFLSTPYFNSVKAGVALDIERRPLTESQTVSSRQEKTEGVVDVLWSHSDTLTFLLRYELEYYRNFNYESGKTLRNHIISAKTSLRF